MTYEALLRLAYKKVREHQGEEEAAKLLLMELSTLDPHAFYMAMKDSVSDELKENYLHQLDQYLINHIPIQHLIGHSYFYGYLLKVNEHVLIPRPETEQLVDHVLYFIDTYFPKGPIHALDLGTGSGCIGLTLAKEEPRIHMIESDISAQALEVAHENATLLDVDVNLIQSDLFQKITGSFDIIVSNPPYIPDSEVAEDIVSKEPAVALYGGSLGVDFYQKILAQAKPFLREKALLAFEHGYQQKAIIKGFIDELYPEAIVIQMKDLQGKDRFTFVGLGGILSEE
ncbi:MAG TPA: peptide chain release factor N(5)-glutamine methyltransferase [Acholeplasmataceae bacterium]|nr:peptide chain release factor N(5)-glutamine methyltransferase [Acholeplasmataceae bacterium]